MRITNKLRDYETGLESIISAGLDCGVNVKFLLPIRNPIDCVRSNIKTGHYRHLTKETSSEAIFSAVVNELRFFHEISEKFPSSTLLIREQEFGKHLLCHLADRLVISRDETWLEQASKLFVIRARSQTSEDVEIYQTVVRRICSDRPDIREKLLNLSPN